MSIHNHKVIQLINKLEDGLLVLILSAMIVLALFQIVSRNLFAEGAVWIDPLLRVLVLWVGLAGAVVAARTDNHIRIDVFTKYLPQVFLPYVKRLVHFFTAAICLLLAWHAARFVYSEYTSASMASAGVPTWVAASIIPVSFALIAVRYLLFLLSPVSRQVIAGSDTARTDS